MQMGTSSQSTTTRDAGDPGGVSRVAAADGTVLAVHVQGGEDARPVVLLHGAPQTHHCWRHVVRELHAARPGRYRTLAVDLRGYGDSELSRSGRYDLETLTSDLEAVVGATTRVRDGDQRVLLVAHDWGGPIAWLYAERHPETLRHLIATNAPHPAAFAREMVHARQALRSWYIGLFQVPRLERALAMRNAGVALLLKMMTASAPHGTFTGDDLAIYRAALERPGRVDAVIAYYREIFRGGIFERRARLLGSPRVTAPATIVWGDADAALAPTHPDAVRPYAARLEVRRLPGVGHWVPEERADAVVQAILDGDSSS
jgi:pimeloyl-ACP methyl ester carboxylesterase